MLAAACADNTPDTNGNEPTRPAATIIEEIKHDTTSVPLAQIPPAAALPAREEEDGPGRIPLKRVPGQSPTMADPVAQRTLPKPRAPIASSSFDGIGQGFVGPSGTYTVQSAPPDTNGAVGPNHYVQTTNSHFVIFNKAGTPLFGPVQINTVFAGFGGGCETNNDGDPVVQYDQFADRWIISQFSVSTTPFMQCVAVSTSGDPMGTYNRYAFSFGNTDFNDYPKIGIWPDGYYFTFNIFANGSSFTGATACAYDRANMVAGAAATGQCFSTGPNFGSLLPSSVDGPVPPPVGSPNYMVAFNANSLDLWKFHVDFANPVNSTFVGPVNFPVAPFNPACGGFGACIPQPGTGQLLDSLADRLMYRLAYRNFGDHETLVVNHSVDSGGGVAGVRWYEVRNPGAAVPELFQQGTFAPDGNNRWMGSVAMDKVGNLAVGYSVASNSLFPSVRYSGRLVSDPPGLLTLGEGTLIDGTGSQTSGLSRWGDYSSLVVDPTDDCTFWYTTEYMAQTGSFNWHTRIGSFTMPSCLGAVADDFVITADPASVVLAGGESATYTVTTALTAGSLQAINLTTSGLPVGVTASFSPSQITTGDSATLTVNASTSVAPGTYVINITGTGTLSTNVTSVTLVVTPPIPVINPTLINGDFETGDLTGWIPTGATITTNAHAGSFSAGVGSNTTPFSGDDSISQSFLIPATGGTLSFFYNINCPDTVTFDWATATLTDLTAGTTTTLFPRTCTNNNTWVQISTDVTAIAGHAVTLTLVSHDDAFPGDPTLVFYDDVTVTPPPPPPSPIINGGFETGDFTGWTPSGTASVVTSPHSGNFAALLGALTSRTNGDSTVTQTFNVPADGGILGFYYQVHCNDVLALGWATASLTDNNTGTTTTLLNNTCKNLGTWVRVSADLAGLAGHSVTITLTNHDDNYPGDSTFTLFDDVTLDPGPPPTPIELIVNGGFETGDFTGWSVSNAASITSAAHSGTHAAIVGAIGPTWGDSKIEQSFVVPTFGGTLSFFYQAHCNDLVEYDWSTATLTDHVTGTTVTLLPKLCKNTGAWVQVSNDLGALAGHYVTLSLVNHDDNYDADVTYTVYDDVSFQ